MTNEEAKKNLLAYAYYVDEPMPPDVAKAFDMAIKALEQPEIIRCKDCKHWNPQLKTANGNGLGICDFHNVALVTSEGFCYWAERGEQE